MGYTKLFTEIVTSSIWSQDDKTRIVWITILALKDKDGVVKAALPGLANAARVSIEDCKKAVEILESPDEYSRSLEHQGRRIEKIEGGWMVLNHFKYRDCLIEDAETVAARERKRRQRERDKGVTSRDPVSVSVSVSDSALNAKDKDKIIPTPPPTRKCPTIDDLPGKGTTTPSGGQIAKPSKDQPPLPKDGNSWLTEYDDIFHASFGGHLGFGRMGKVFKALEAEYGRAKTIEGWRVYCDKMKGNGQYVTAESYAKSPLTWMPVDKPSYTPITPEKMKNFLTH